MTCPRCYAEFTRRPGACPECGVKLLRSVSGVVKTSAVLISAGARPGFYRSVHDVPQPLRSRLMQATNGSNSGTIVIADRAGKQQITEIMSRRESSCDDTTGQPDTPPRLAFPWLLWASAFLILMAAAIIAAAFMAR